MSTTETFFSILKEYRESKSIQIEEISEYTKINPKYIEAIEEGDFDILPQALFQNAVNELNQINFIQGIELPLWSKDLGVAGTTDCIANYNNTLSVIDFKTATRPKKKEWLTSYFLQETAYALMYEELMGIPIKQLVTLVAAEDGKIQIFVESKTNFVDELKQCINEFNQIKVVA